MKFMIKVLMFNKLYGPSLGGVERVVYDICEEIKDKVELTVLCANTKPVTEIERKDKYTVIKSASLGRILSSVHLGFATPWWWLRTKNDIIHFHFPSPVAEIYCLALYPRKQPLIVSYHADITGYNKALFFYSPVLKKFLKRADRIIVSSPAILERSPFLRKFQNKCAIITPGIDIGRFKLSDKNKQASLELREKFPGRLLLFVGRLVAYKGLDYLIKAMENIDATLLIVGDGPEKSKLKSLAKKLRVDKKIFFMGKVIDEELSAYYHACDMFVLPSINDKEEFGLVQLEAHACGKPVVSTALPTGVSFANINGLSGLVVPPKSAQDLARAINKLLENEGLRQQLGRQAKERAELKFNRKIMAQNILDIYRNFIP